MEIDLRMKEKGLRIFHNNALTHVARQTVALLQNFITHPPYTPDLEPSDYHLFPKLVKRLSTRRFCSNKEVKLWQRLQKYINRNDYYVEQ